MSFNSPNSIELKLLRKQCEISSNEIADKFAVSTRTVRNWESGRNAPSASFIEFLKVSASTKRDVLEMTYIQILENPDLTPKQLPWFRSLSDIQEEYGSHIDLLQFSIYRAVIADMLITLGDVTICSPCEQSLPSELYLTQWLKKAQ